MSTNLKGIDRMKAANARKPHGNLYRYISGCRCEPCREANSEYNQERRYLKAMGQSNSIVSAERARKHLRSLQKDHHVFVDAISLLTGIHRRTVMQIRNGRMANIREAKERLILAVGPEAAMFNGKVPAEVTIERLSRIKAAGLSFEEIGRRLGFAGPPRIGKSEAVTAVSAVRVRRLYYEVVMKPRMLAQRRCVNPSFNQSAFA
jgi:hypothetical protein